MAKQAPAATLDSMLDYVAGSNSMVVLTSEPANFAAVAAATLATVAMAGGDFVKAAGTGTGARQVTVGAKSGVSVSATGTATHIALVNTTGSTLRYVTTCTSQGLTSGNTVNIPAWVINMTQPT